MLKSPNFIKESAAELKQVVWPSKQQVIRLTIIVLAVSVLTGLFIGALDFIFLQSIGWLVK